MLQLGTWLPVWLVSICRHTCRLLQEPVSFGVATQEAYQALREATRLLALPWPFTPVYPLLPHVQDDSDSESPVHRVAMHVGFAVLKPDYAPEKTSVELDMPCTLAEAEEALQASRFTSGFLRYPHLIHVRPQPLQGLAVFVALPRWYPSATVLCLNTAAIDGRIFATFAPDRLDAAELCWLAQLPSRLKL